jgi:hypothetical protein
MGLAQFVPQLVKWISGSDKAEQVAQKAIDIAQSVTGQQSGDAALKSLQDNPDLVIKYRQAILEQELEFQKLAIQNASDINKTMQSEAGAEHWPTYSWRPAIGFAVAINLTVSVVVVAIAYIGVMFFQTKTETLSYLPAMLGSMAALIGVASPILGIASWFRGKMQADPKINTDNKG